VHVTLRIVPGQRPLRSCATFRTIHAALCAGAEKEGFRLVDYSVQSNHFHFIVEARSSRDLSRGVQGLAIRLARRVNRRFARQGKLFRDRFHSRVLRDPLQARNARRYVLNNARRHVRGARRVATSWLDTCSSAPFSPDWTIPRGTPRAPPTGRDTYLLALGNAAVPPHTWLLRVGWSLAGPLVVTEVPGPV
jgi:REP element-mobilizing transposase RayT